MFMLFVKIHLLQIKEENTGQENLQGGEDPQKPFIWEKNTMSKR